jgi:hypothetical protein
MPDTPITKKQLGSWGRTLATVLPIMGTIVASTWALASRAKDSENELSLLKTEQARQATIIERHAGQVERIPLLVDAMTRLERTMDTNNKAATKLTESMIRLETRLENRR